MCIWHSMMLQAPEDNNHSEKKMKSHDKRLLALALALAAVVERVVWLSVRLCKVTDL